jgi:hypothetical protein
LLGEAFEIRQLAPGHHEIAEAEKRSEQPPTRLCHFENEPRRAVVMRDEDIGQHRAHDGRRQVLSRLDRQDPPLRPTAGCRERLTRDRFGELLQLGW